MKVSELISIKRKKGAAFKSTITCLGGYTINPLITEKRFDFKHTQNDEFSTCFITTEHIANINEVLSFAQKNKLERPSMEDVLLFAEQLPQEERQGKIIFLHEVVVWSGFMFYSALDYEEGNQSITMISSDGYYPEGTRFAFRSY